MSDAPGLFGPDAGRRRGSPLAAGPEAPLAARMRPRTLDDFVGQEALVGEGGPLRELIAKDRVPSMILWGPPGCGKTTLAAIIAGRTGAHFEPFSAVTEGIPRVRQLIAQARDRRRAGGADTILFVDEIHRFNRAQQDAFLPHVESGTIVLVGATTENPSFEVVGPLLSRTRVFVLEPLAAQQVRELSLRALRDREHGLGDLCLEIDADALDRLAELETAAELVGTGERIAESHVEQALQRRFPRYDKSGDEHYNLISALHKSVRGSDPDGALYWLARMLDGGEDALYIARRLVRMASEDVGLADPDALRVCLAARDAYHFLGSPEGELALAEACVYLAVAPKSNRVYVAMSQAMKVARETPAEPVPLHIRNAPTRLMQELGYGEGYMYDHDFGEAVAPQAYLPPSLSGYRFYRPGSEGREETIGERLRRIRAARHGVESDDPATRQPDSAGPASGIREEEGV